MTFALVTIDSTNVDGDVVLQRWAAKRLKAAALKAARGNQSKVLDTSELIPSSSSCSQIGCCHRYLHALVRRVLASIRYVRDIDAPQALEYKVKLFVLSKACFWRCLPGLRTPAPF